MWFCTSKGLGQKWEQRKIINNAGPTVFPTASTREGRKTHKKSLLPADSCLFSRLKGFR